MARRRYARDDYYDDRPRSYRRRTSYGYSRRRSRRSSERQVEMFSFLAIVLLFILQLMAGAAFSTVTILLLGSLVLLGSASYQTSRRWRVNPMTWIGGALMLVFAILGMQGNPVPLGPLLPLGIFAAVLVASFVTGEF
jgi:uncharacterized membrane protein YhaH (DUF805 family)